jgi:hypothetical protein
MLARQSVVVAAFALSAIALSVSQAVAKPSCVLAGGEATMLTGDLAKFMAEAALKNSISGMGAKPAGKIALTCNAQFASTYCIARQRACK